MRSKEAKRVIAWAFAGTVLTASLWYLLATFQWLEIADTLRQVNVGWLGVAGVSILMYWFVRTVRWHVLLRQLGVDISFIDLYLCTAVALGLAIVTPLQSGEVLKIELLKKYGKIERFSGYSSFFVERVTDLAVVFCLAIVSLLVSPDLGIDQWVAVRLIVLVMAVGAVATAVLWNVRLPGSAGRFQASVRDCVRNARTLVTVLLLTLAGWALVAVGWYACLSSIGCRVGYMNTVMIMSTMTPVHILSLIPGAVGIAEASCTLFLLHLGQSAPHAQAGSLMLRFYGIMILALAVPHWYVRLRTSITLCADGSSRGGD